MATSLSVGYLLLGAWILLPAGAERWWRPAAFAAAITLSVGGVVGAAWWDPWASPLTRWIWTGVFLAMVVHGAWHARRLRALAPPGGPVAGR